MPGRPPFLKLRRRSPSPTATPPKIGDCPVLTEDKSLDHYFWFESKEALTEAGGFGFVMPVVAQESFQALVKKQFRKFKLKAPELALRPLVVKQVGVTEPAHLKEVQQESLVLRYLMLLRQRLPILAKHLPGYYGCFSGVSDNKPVAYIVMDRVLSEAGVEAAEFDLDVWQKAEAGEAIDSKHLMDRDRPVEVFDMIVESFDAPDPPKAIQELCVKVFRPLAKVLATMHRYKVVHGDIKPSNLMYGHLGTSDGSPSSVGLYLVDFGHSCLDPTLGYTQFPSCKEHPLGPDEIWSPESFDSIDPETRLKIYQGKPLSFDDFRRNDWWGFLYTCFTSIGGGGYPVLPKYFAKYPDGGAAEIMTDFHKAWKRSFHYYLEGLKVSGLCPKVWALCDAIMERRPLSELLAKADGL